MAKKQKIDNDLLLEAVVKYADVCKRKIKYKELAEWSAANISGLEDVKDYMFSRSMVETDPITGKKKQRERPCTVRIKEINASSFRRNFQKCSYTGVKCRNVHVVTKSRTTQGYSFYQRTGVIIKQKECLSGT